MARVEARRGHKTIGMEFESIDTGYQLWVETIAIDQIGRCFCIVN